MSNEIKICKIFIIFLMSFSCLPVFPETENYVPKIGLVLGGGGARGAAHIGVLKAFEKENIKIDYLVGTSVGALIAALYSGGVSPEEIEKFALNGNLKKTYRANFSFVRALFIQVNKLIKTLFRRPFYAGLYNDHKLHHFVNKSISNEKGVIDMTIPLHIIALDLISGQPVVIDSGDVGLAVQASTAIPTLRQPVPIGDQLLVDGAVVSNIPIEEAKKMGADIVVAVNVDQDESLYSPGAFRTYEGVITRAISLGLKAQSEKILEYADVVIQPGLGNIGILDLDVESLAMAIQSGEYAALQAIPEIKKILEGKLKSRRIVFNFFLPSQVLVPQPQSLRGMKLIGACRGKPL